MTEECTECGKAFQIGDTAYATTLGSITELGFEMDRDEPWDEILCTVCYEHKKE
jgi:hypothetical protein